jgi:hypothetical protein
MPRAHNYNNFRVVSHYAHYTVEVRTANGSYHVLGRAHVSRRMGWHGGRQTWFFLPADGFTDNNLSRVRGSTQREMVEQLAEALRDWVANQDPSATVPSEGDQETAVRNLTP